VPRVLSFAHSNARALGTALALSLYASGPAAAQTPRDSTALADSAKALVARAEAASNLGTRDASLRGIELHTQAAALYRSAGDRASEANSLLAIGFAKRLLGRPDSARALYERALIVARDHGAREVLGRILNAIGGLQSALGQRDSALVAHQEALAIARELGDRVGEIEALNSLGITQSRLAHPDSALFYSRSSLQIARELGHRKHEGSALSNIGFVHREVGRLDSTLVYYQQALAIARELNAPRDIAAVLSNLGLIHSDQGRLDSALVYWREVLEIQRAAGDLSGQAVTLNNIAAMHMRLGRPDSGVAMWSRALEITREVKDRPGEGNALNNLGYAHYMLGRPDSAGVYLHQAIEIAREVGDRRQEALLLGNVGGLHSRLGRPDSALVYFRQAVRLAREVGNRSTEATHLRSIGDAHMDRGRPDSALIYHQAALEMKRALGDREGEGHIFNSIGSVYLKLGRLDSSLVYFRNALRIRRLVGNRTDVGGSLNNLARLYFNQALAIAREVRFPTGEASVLNSIGEIHRERGRSDSALIYLTQALAISGEIKDPATNAATLNNIGLLHNARGQPDSALVYLHRALEMRRALRNRLDVASSFLNIGGTLYRYPLVRDLRSAVAYFDSSAAVRASVAVHVGSDPGQVSFAETFTDLFRFWTLAWLARAPEVGSKVAALSSLAATERGRAQALLSLMRVTTGNPGAGTVQQSGANLAEEGARLVEAVISTGATGLNYASLGDTLIVWLIEPTGEVSMARQVISRDSLASLVGSLRAGLGADDPNTRDRLAMQGGPQLEMRLDDERPLRRRGLQYAAAAARDLAHVLLPPTLAARLPDSAEIVIVPQGVLATVPFAALPLGRGSQSAAPFANGYTIRYAPSLAALGQAEARPALKNRSEIPDALVVGNPVMPAVATHTGERHQLAPLPGAEAEARTVAEQLGAGVIPPEAATENAIRRRLPRAPLVHLATHGYAYATDARARQSFVALAPDSLHDGFLTVGEILDDSTLTVAAELVVLSACQTGMGDLKEAEGTIGLQRAFLAKGARSVLVSLWSVSDEVTQELMGRFYAHWLEDDDRPSKAKALWRAQDDVRRGGFDHPRFWAAFQLVGAN